MKIEAKCWLSGLAVVGALVTGASSAGAQSYTIQDLGTLGGFFSAGNGINDTGHVAGVSRRAGSSTLRGFYWDGTTMTALPTLGRDTQAMAINGSDEVVGSSNLTLRVRHAFSWVGGVMTDLGTLGGSVSDATALNEGGTIAGSSTNTGDTELHAVLWNAHGAVTDLGLGQAFAINNRGTAAGSLGGGELPLPVTWWHGATTTLPLLTGTDSGIAYGINNRDDVVGEVSDSATGAMHAVLWAGGAVTDLGGLSPGESAKAYDVNDSGTVVGVSGPGADGTTRGVVWRGGAITDLNAAMPADSGWTISAAQSVNNCGQITGSGVIHGALHAYVLTPVGATCGTSP